MWAYPPRRILAAVDFGDASAAALRVAGELARRYGATLTAVHAETLEAPPYFTSGQVRAIEQQRRSARREAGRYLERHATKLAGMAAAPLIADGPAVAGILAAGRGQDLIVMGTHGRRGPARWWAGSVAERIVREARSPVLVVRTAGASVPAVFKRVLVVTPGATYDDAVLRYARGLAETFGGSVTRDAASTRHDAKPNDASLVVLAQPESVDPLGATATSDRLLRTCRRPLLFVPSI